MTARDLVAALRAAGLAEVDDSALARALYSSDASLYRVTPQVVAFPRHPDEVVAALEVCRRLRVPLTARGAGTSIAGNAVGPGLVLDLSRHLHRIERVDPESRTATVQPGVVHADLARRAASHGLRFGPDPSTADRCTVGGMVGNNACGSRALAYGRTVDNVVALEVVTGSGERLQLASPGAGGSVASGMRPSPTLAAAAAAVDAGLGVIRTELGRFPRQVSGYGLEHALPERGRDLARALVGSEGTLALVLGATVRLVPDPPARSLAVLGYPTMADAADAVPGLLGLHPTACEGLDARIVTAVRRRFGARRVPPLPRGAGWLLVETVADTPAAAIAGARAVVGAGGALDARVVSDPGEAAALWQIRVDGAGLASRTLEGRPAHAGWEDAAVPVPALGAYLREFDALVDAYGLSGMPYGHFGDGCVHVRLDFPFEQGTDTFRSFLQDAARLVAGYGGSLSGEHGDGRARSELLPLMYSPDALALFAAVKQVFDPDGVLNPGMLVDPAPLASDLRPLRERPLREGISLALDADHGDFSAAVHRCTGVGKCRADRSGAGAVMCPSYLATREEKDSTRGRARVLQELLDGTQIGGWRAPAVHDALDLCLACKACSSECPTGVDMATYKSEVLHQAYRRRLRPRSHYALGQLPRWARLAARAPTTVNALLRAPVTGSFARLLAGVAPERRLPAFAPRTFRSWFASAAPSAGTGRPVMLWVDTFTEHFDPQIGQAAVRVLTAAGYDVQVPTRPACCGLTWFTTGQHEGARRQLRRSLDALQPALAQGIPVVGLEPSCTAMLRGDAAELLPQARQLRTAVVTLAELLTRTPGWRPPDLRGTRVVAQPHCHHRAVLGWDTDAALLRDSGAQVTAVAGCCGLAGNFGMERGHHDVSVAVAQHALLPALRAAEPGTAVLADGFSCRVQVDALAEVPARHLAQLLADARP